MFVIIFRRLSNTYFVSVLKLKSKLPNLFKGDRIYCIGGIGGKGGTYEQRLASMECLDMSDKSETSSTAAGGGKRWKCLASMSTPRSSHTCEIMNGLIYVVGGGDGADWLSSAEV